MDRALVMQACAAQVNGGAWKEPGGGWVLRLLGDGIRWHARPLTKHRDELFELRFTETSQKCSESHPNRWN
jgi:hypothetical protein